MSTEREWLAAVAHGHNVKLQQRAQEHNAQHAIPTRPGLSLRDMWEVTALAYERHRRHVAEAVEDRGYYMSECQQVGLGRTSDGQWRATFFTHDDYGPWPYGYVERRRLDDVLGYVARLDERGLARAFALEGARL